MFVMTHLSRVTNMRAGNELVGTQMSTANTKHTHIGQAEGDTAIWESSEEIEAWAMMTL